MCGICLSCGRIAPPPPPTSAELRDAAAVTTSQPHVRVAFFSLFLFPFSYKRWLPGESTCTVQFDSTSLYGILTSTFVVSIYSLEKLNSLHARQHLYLKTSAGKFPS